MAAPSQLRNPPIQEALVDFRVAFSGPVTRTELEPIKNLVAEHYPKAKLRHQVEAMLKAGPGEVPNVSTQTQFHGLFVSDESDSRLAQFRVDGFTFNWLKGYRNAEELFSEALDLWHLYVTAAKARAVLRLAVRYINQLRLPFRDGDDLGRFLLAAPVMPPDAPQTLARFLVRVTIPIDEPSEATAIVTQRLEQASEQMTPYTLDIDIFKTGEFAVDRDSLSAMLKDLRVIKNRLFFAFVTDEALENCR